MRSIAEGGGNLGPQFACARKHNMCNYQCKAIGQVRIVSPGSSTCYTGILCYIFLHICFSIMLSIVQVINNFYVLAWVHGKISPAVKAHCKWVGGTSLQRSGQ